METWPEGGIRKRAISLLIGLTVGLRWFILLVLLLAVLVAAVFGGLWETVVVALFGLVSTPVVAHVLARWREREAEERAQLRELRAHEREREKAMDADQQLRGRELDAALKQRRIEGYRGFVFSFFDSMLPQIQEEVATSKNYDSAKGEKATIALNDMTKNLTLWGDDEILLRFLLILDGFCKGETKEPLPDVDSLCELFLTIRMKLDYQNEGLNKYSLYPIFGIHPPVTASTGASVGGKSA